MALKTARPRLLDTFSAYNAKIYTDGVTHLLYIVVPRLAIHKRVNKDKSKKPEAPTLQ